MCHPVYKYKIFKTKLGIFQSGFATAHQHLLTLIKNIEINIVILSNLPLKNPYSRSFCKIYWHRYLCAKYQEKVIPNSIIDKNNSFCNSESVISKIERILNRNVKVQIGTDALNFINTTSVRPLQPCKYNIFEVPFLFIDGAMILMFVSRFFSCVHIVLIEWKSKINTLQIYKSWEHFCRVY